MCVCTWLSVFFGSVLNLWEDFRLADHKPIQNDWLCKLIFLPHGLLPWEQPCKQQRGAEI